MPLLYKPGFGQTLESHIDADPYGRTKSQLARRIKRSASSLHRWVAEEQQVPYNDLIWLCRVLGLSVEQRAELIDLAGYVVDHPLMAGQSFPEFRTQVQAQYRPGFGQLLRHHIQANSQGRTQRQLAKESGCSASNLNHWIAERRQIPFNDLYRLCHCLALTDAQRATLVERAGYEVDRPVEAVATAKPEPPRQRPPRPPYFVGREAEFNRLISQLEAGQVVTLCAAGGMGKSALAAETVWRLTSQDELPPLFPDGLIYHNFYQQPQVALALQHIVFSFGEKPLPTADQAALRLLSQKRVLLLLDGAEDADNLPRLLAVCGHCRVLITSRRRADAVADWIDLPALSKPQALALLQKWGKNWAANKPTAEKICQLLGGLPLAVRLAGRYLMQNETEAATYLRWLQQTPLQALNQGQRRLESVPILLAHSFKQVSAKAQQALSIIGQLALAPITDEAIAHALNLSTANVRPLLAALTNYGLLNQSAGQYEVAHALIHTFSRHHPPPKPVLKRLLHYYTQWVVEQGQRGAAGFHQLDQQRAHLLALLEGCIARAAWPEALALAVATQNYLDMRGLWIERLTVLQFGLQAAEALNNQDEAARLLGVIGLTYRDLGQYPEALAHIKQGIAVAQAAHNQQQEAFCLGNLGLIYQDTAQPAEALVAYKQAVALSKLGDTNTRLGYQLVGLATQLRVGGETNAAIDYFEQALIVAQNSQDRRLQGLCLTGLGTAYRHLPHPPKAIAYCQQALAIAKETGDLRRKGAYLGNLAMAHYTAKEMARAETHLEQAIAIAQQIEDRREESNHLGHLGLVLCVRGKPAEGMAMAQQALAIAQAVGDRYREGNHSGVLALAHRLNGDLDMAIEWGYRALAIARELKDKRGEAHHLHNLELTFRQLENEAEATH